MENSSFTPSVIPFKNIQRGTSTIQFVEQIVAFLEEHLPNFTTERKIHATGYSEEDVTEQLYFYLQRKTKFNSQNIEYPFEFQPETPQRPISSNGKKGHKRRIDIGVNIDTVDLAMELVYCIEAKRLPTGKQGTEREKEYVIGKGGGISRFKNNQHGIDRNGGLIPKNCMIGYVEKLDFAFWMNTINSWIVNDTDWPKSEILIPAYFSSTAKLRSSHNRATNQIVELSHFWITIPN